ncbi:MAG: response regulator, partial [Candidatus Fimimonas sp.]
MLNSDDLHVDYLSPNVEKLTGIALQDACADIHVLNNLIQEYSVRILDELSGLQPDQQGEWDRIYIHQQTGEKRWFHVVAMTSQIGGSKKYIMVMSDRTNDKTINQALEEAVAAAQSANRAKSSFLSNMSHDIRTPMNAIIGFATLAAANVTEAEKVKDYLSKILSSSNHLLSLINDILDMSRIESGKIQLTESEANLSDMLHDIKTIIGVQIHAKQLDLFMDVMDVVDEDVYCDKTRINQVLLNLLSNAIKFTPSGGTVSVRVAQLPNAPEGKGLYEIRVKDTGIGMSPEFVEKIFEPFERERTSTVSRIQGTGLGMAISKNIVDMMGGTIEVLSEMGKGTEFVVKLALKLQSGRRSVEKIKELENLRALVVDDNFNTCDSVTKMLTQVGMRSEWTLSGREAVLRAKQSLELNDPFHAYIIDWRMPDMNGIEVTRQIRSLGDNTPIIILTAYDWSDIEEEARAAGVTAFCAKPMFMSDLRYSLLSALGQQNSQKEQHLAFEQNVTFCDKRLLLVEDNELNREIAMEILSAHGFTIDVAQNGAEAVEKVTAAQPTYDLVLMDIQMPVMNGYEATRRIRALENEKLSQVPIFAMTANAFDEDRKAALECGMDGFFTKPLELKDVLETLAEFFKTK